MFLQNVDSKTSEIGFGILWEVILEGLPKGPKSAQGCPTAVRKRFKGAQRIGGTQGIQKAAKGSPRAPQREPKGFREFSLYIQTPNQPPQWPLCYIYIYMVFFSPSSSK